MLRRVSRRVRGRPRSAAPRARLAPALGVLLLASCDIGWGMEQLGLRTVAEVPAAQLAEELAAGEARVVQRSAPDEGLPPLPGALLLEDGALPPPAWPRDGRPVRAVATEPDAALALAARLRRAGIAPVAVVRGAPAELAALADARTARAAQPTRNRHHPTPD